MTEDAFQKIVIACENGVSWCNGDEVEAIDAFINANYCGLCFQKKEKLEDLEDIIIKRKISFSELKAVFRKDHKFLIHSYICSDCLKRIMDECEKTLKPV